MSVKEFKHRTKLITSSPKPYDPSIDLVANDLRDIPRVLHSINEAWADPSSPNFISGRCLAKSLVECIKAKHLSGDDNCTDILIGGIEASLWVAEQFATDLRSLFPELNISTISANKLLDVGGRCDILDLILYSLYAYRFLSKIFSLGTLIRSWTLFCHAEISLLKPVYF